MATAAYIGTDLNNIVLEYTGTSASYLNIVADKKDTICYNCYSLSVSNPVDTTFTLECFYHKTDTTPYSTTIEIIPASSFFATTRPIPARYIRCTFTSDPYAPTSPRSIYLTLRKHTNV